MSAGSYRRWYRPVHDTIQTHRQMWNRDPAQPPLSTVTDHGYIIITWTGYIIMTRTGFRMLQTLGYIIITWTGLKKVSKCVLKHKSFNNMLDFLFSGGFVYYTCVYMAGN